MATTYVFYKVMKGYNNSVRLTEFEKDCFYPYKIKQFKEWMAELKTNELVIEVGYYRPNDSNSQKACSKKGYIYKQENKIYFPFQYTEKEVKDISYTKPMLNKD